MLLLLMVRGKKSLYNWFSVINFMDLEDEWLYSDEGKLVNYNNLSPGNYTFIVQVKNEEDVWSDPTGILLLSLTPIWKRWWFWLLVIAIGSTSIICS